jgi:hypothetical protein
MAINYGPIYDNVSEITGPSGWYAVKVYGTPVIVYVNQTYSGGGWVMVLANSASTGGMNNLTYDNATSGINYRLSGTIVSPESRVGSSLASTNCWIGLNYWSALAGRLTPNTVTISQFVSSVNGDSIGSATNTKRYRWRFNGFTQTYATAGVVAISDETGTGSPGFYSYHALNGFSLTTYDRDQDVYGANCSTLYNNNPFWYGACWSGNYFAGGSGYADAPYWDSSGGDYHNYGAVYIK